MHVVLLAEKLGSMFSDYGDYLYLRLYDMTTVILCIQAFLFRIPKWIWKKFEAGKLKSVINGLENSLPKEEKEEVQEKHMLANVFQKFNGQVNHRNLYFFVYFLCELLNLINVIAQCEFNQYFLDKKFYNHPSHVYEPFYNETTPFPRFGRCRFKSIGPSGNQQQFEVICVYLISIINERAYFMLW